MSNCYLSPFLRRTLEKAVKDARVVAEEATRDAIQRLGVSECIAPSYLNDAEKKLRRRLRAHARTLGDTINRENDSEEIKRLIEEAAFAHWHRMLFARFLAERDLLRHPKHNVPVSLEDCRELAAQEELADEWAVSEQYAAAMLPAVFRMDNPSLALKLDPVHTQKLNRLVINLDTEIFQAEDSLGWTYQFWRAKEKESINRSGVKIGAKELPAVTQLFTDPYMVQYLLHNTLGAWWAGKVLSNDPVLAKTAENEEVLRTACALPDYHFDMLRFVRDRKDGLWRPASGTFLGWPTEAKAITMLDPCCGSGHFLTEALAILAALRQTEEGMSSSEAVAAALRDNLHGLEIDGRCVQIAVFAVALSAWRIGGWQSLPQPHIAWVGAPPPLPKQDFEALAEGDAELKYALSALYDMFVQAPLLGSLLKPESVDLFEAEKMRQIDILLDPLLERARQAEPDQQEGVYAARGMADAAALLHRRYVLLATNVPFLARGKQLQKLKNILEENYNVGRGNLATATLLKMVSLAQNNGSVAAVTPQNWLFQTSYSSFRTKLQTDLEFKLLVSLGNNAFCAVSGSVVITALFVFEKAQPTQNSKFVALDLGGDGEASRNYKFLRDKELKNIPQAIQNRTKNNQIILENVCVGKTLAAYSTYKNGLQTGDYPRFAHKFWEQYPIYDGWRFFAGTIKKTKEYDGLTGIVKWDNGEGAMANSHSSTIRGTQAWGKKGIAVSAMGRLSVCLYTGALFDDNTVCVIANDEEHLAALWAYCSSKQYHDDVRVYDKSLKVRCSLVRPVFELEKWQKVAAKKYPLGLPEPYSDDPCQWIFHGHPSKSDKGTVLHVALARLGGFRWPAETTPDMHLAGEAREWIKKSATLAERDNDGLLCLPAVAGEKPLAIRLRTYLADAFDMQWSDALELRLVAEADEVLDKKASRDCSLENWLRDRAFRQHCTLFGHRPFLWHIWDGLKDGFSVFAHYHRFDQATLRKLTYTMLGDWLRRAKSENNEQRYEKGRELQQKLEKVMAGEKPLDIFIRWKSCAQQPLGWDSHLENGVRMNIRPFVEAGILKFTPKIKWTKDRGRDEESASWFLKFKGERINDHHTTLNEKKTAREESRKLLKATK